MKRFCFVFGVAAIALVSCDRGRDDGRSGGAAQGGSKGEASGSGSLLETRNSSAKPARQATESRQVHDGTVSDDLRAASATELAVMLAGIDTKKSYDNAIQALLIFRALSEKDVALALAGVSRMPEVVMLPEAREVLEKIAQSDPDAVRDWILAVGDCALGQSPKLAYVLVDAMAKSDPARAIAMVAEIRSRDRVTLLVRAFAGIMDGDAALRLAQAHLSGPELGMITANVIGAVSAKDLERALDMAALQPPEMASICYQQMMRSQILSMNGQVASLVARIPASMLQSVLSSPLVVEQLVKDDPSLAVEKIAKVPFTESTSGIYSRLASALCVSDIGKAMDFVNDLPDGTATQSIVRSMFGRMTESDSQEALSRVDQLREADRIQALRGIAKKLAETDTDKALLIAQNAAPSDQQDIYREIARASAYQAPANAVKMLEDTTLSEKLGSDFRQAMLDNTVQTWAKQDLSAAQQWVEKLPTTDAPKGVQGLMTTWMKTDPIAASGWLSTQPASPARDAGARVLISQIKDTDPEMAEQWRKTLPPPVK